jgi:hypothetical protein
MDSRQDGKRFPGCLKEIARPSLSVSVGLFVLPRLRRASCSMINLRTSRLFLVILMLCLCVSTQFVQFANQAVGIPTSEMAEADFNETDFEEDFLFETTSNAILSGLIFPKLGLQNLDFQVICLSPVAPPPKPA